MRPKRTTKIWSLVKNILGHIRDVLKELKVNGYVTGEDCSVRI